MPLASRQQTKSAMHGTPCSIGLVYEDVADNPVELRELNTLLYDEGNTAGQVFEYLTVDGGYDVGFQSVNRHRGQRCRCFREQPSSFCVKCRRDTPSCICGVDQ